MLVWLSNAMRYVAPVGLVAFIGGSVVWTRVKNRAGVRNVVDPLKLKIPIFGVLTQKIALSRFTRNLGTMLRSGVPILQSLDIVGGASGNVVVQRAANDVMESVRSGQSLAGPLAQHRIFPAMVVQMMSVGEDTGRWTACCTRSRTSTTRRSKRPLRL